MRARERRPCRSFRCSLVPVILAVAWCGDVLPVSADEPLTQPPVTVRDPLPYGQTPVDYDSPASTDPIARLHEELATGTRTLGGDSPQELLRAVLAALKIPESSQLLVFSKTAANTRQVSPRNPRAIYFNDDAYVGWVPGGTAIELCSLDPIKGALFYTLDVDAETPRFERQRSCLTCHVSQMTLQVPGVMVRSMQTDVRGTPRVGFSGVNHDTDFAKRWGGWYVTGSRSPLQHFGNVYGDEAIEQHREDGTLNSERETLRDEFDTSLHLRETSDVLPHLVFDHQWHAHNLMIRAHHEALFVRHSDVEQQLVRYLLFLDAPPLPAPVAGDPEFRRDFLVGADRVPSLREFDLKVRLLKHHCSWLIESRQFAELPADVKRRVADGISAVLNGESPDSKSIPACERAATLRILERQLPDLFPVVP